VTQALLMFGVHPGNLGLVWDLLMVTWSWRGGGVVRLMVWPWRGLFSTLLILI